MASPSCQTVDSSTSKEQRVGRAYTRLPPTHRPPLSSGRTTKFREVPTGDPLSSKSYLILPRRPTSAAGAHRVHWGGTSQPRSSHSPKCVRLPTERVPKKEGQSGQLTRSPESLPSVGDHVRVNGRVFLQLLPLVVAGLLRAQSATKKATEETASVSHNWTHPSPQH